MAYKILIVDDNDNNLYTLSSLLDTLNNVHTIQAKDGREALACLIRETVDLIILDIQLPDLSGFDVAKIIKERKSTMAIPIIFATAVFKSDEFILKGYELGAVDYILKPFNMEIILSKVRYYQSVTEERKAFTAALEATNKALEDHVHELQKLEAELRTSEANWRQLGQNIPSLIELFDSHAVLRFTNNKEEDSLFGSFTAEHGMQIHDLVRRTLKEKKSNKTVMPLATPDKAYYFEVNTLYLDEASDSRCMLIVSDITLRHQYEEDMAYIGFHDQLTGLGNRHFWNSYVSDLDIIPMLPITLIMADVNGLKLINDGFGHTAGDELIITVAECLKAAASEDATIVRWGGDEFLILLPNTDRTMSGTIVTAIAQSIQDQRIADMFPVSIAMGEVTSEIDDFSFEELIRSAEDKMYVNKLRQQSSYRSFIVESLKGALFEQDYETKDHTERIKVMAAGIADHLKLSQIDKDKLALLGSLHDIGKIGISQSILNQKGKLSEIDWNIVKRHPEIGYRICNSVPELSAIAELILSHHERWDGTGYPRGLKGNQIPMLARLIAIIDTYDVITNARPYKEKQSTEWAMKEIRRCAGSQFDPNLVSVFEHVHKIMVDRGELITS